MRHGETEWNRVGRFRGHIDVPLNERGIEQARLVAERLKTIQANAIFASPLSRTMETAQAIAAFQLRRPIQHDGLLDLNYGAWEGKSTTEVAREDGKRYREWLTHPGHVRIPQGETLQDLRQRAYAALNELAPQDSAAPVVLVSHDMVGRILVCTVLDLSNNSIWRISQDNTGITIFDRIEKGFNLRTVNDTAHLESRDLG